MALRELIRLDGLYYLAGYASYRFRAKNDRNSIHQHVRTAIHFDVPTGDPVIQYVPTGKYAGNTMSRWLHTLHPVRV